MMMVILLLLLFFANTDNRLLLLILTVHIMIITAKLQITPTTKILLIRGARMVKLTGRKEEEES